MLSKPFRNMLFNAILKSLVCRSYIPTITVALVLVDDRTLLVGFWTIPMIILVDDRALLDNTYAGSPFRR